MSYLNPYDLAEIVGLEHISTGNLKQFKRKLLVEIELSDNEINVKNNMYSKAECIEIFNDIEIHNRRLEHYYSIYQNEELNNLLYGLYDDNYLLRLKNDLMLEDRSLIKFISPILTEQITKHYKRSFIRNRQKIISLQFPLEEIYLEKIYAPVYKIIKEKSEEIIALGKEDDLSIYKVKSLLQDIDAINALPEYFLKIRSSLALSLRNLSIDAWNDKRDIVLAQKLIDLATQFRVDSKTEVKILNDVNDLKDVEENNKYDVLIDQLNAINDELKFKRVSAENAYIQVNKIVVQAERNDSIMHAIRTLSLTSWNDREDMPIALKFNKLAMKFIKSNELMKILLEDSQVLTKLKKENSCHYCNDNIATVDNSVQVSMWKYETGIAGRIAMNIFGGSIRYTKREVLVPRCKKCHKTHKNYGMFEFSKKSQFKNKTTSFVQYYLNDGWNIGEQP